ncbi:MAG: ABC-2 transporter permease [Candidatus Izimaplasma sp.]|nr:ABC-2 transporter permease [Candidatus Izimaplasma bacterium]
MIQQWFSNTKKLTIFFLKRDRIKIPIWILSITALTLIVAGALPNLFSDLEDLQAIAIMMENPAMVSMFGPAYGVENYDYGAVMANMMIIMTAVIVGVMAIMIVASHTRGDEEEGRLEMIRSLPVGRAATLAATFISMFITFLALALINGFGLYILNIESMDFNGSMLYGFGIGMIGFMFSAITAVFAQLTQNHRGTLGYSFAILGIGYVVRGIGDISFEPLAWITPLKWMSYTQVYVNDIWWPILLIILVSILLYGLAFYLSSIRDLDAGFIQAKAGKDKASKYFKSPLALAIKISKTMIIGWLIALFILGASYGSIFGDVEYFLETNDMYQQLLPNISGVSLTEQFLSVIIIVCSIAATIPGLLAIIKLNSEEKKKRMEVIISTPTSRHMIIIQYLVFAMILTLISLLITGFGLWVAIYSVMDNPIALGVVIKGIIIYLPASFIMIGLSAILIGYLPKFTSITWYYLVIAFFFVYLGSLLQLPEWMINISIFAHIPQVPIETINYLILFVMLAISIIMMGIGIYGYKRRDFQT